MRSFSGWTATRAILASVVCTLLEIPVAAHAADIGTGHDAGRKIAFSTSKGNCLACHIIPGGESPGNIGPPLIAMKSRYASRDKIRKIIWDPESINPGTPMPPFGKNLILSRQEIDLVVDFIWAF